MDMQHTNEGGNKMGTSPAALFFNHGRTKAEKATALKMTLHPSTEYTTGYIQVRLAHSNNGVFFKWDKSVEFDLNLVECAEFIRVIRGECESINEGRGLTNDLGDNTLNLRFGHVFYPESGYDISLSRTPNDGTETYQEKFHLTNAEALAVCEVITSSMRLLAFGI